MAIRVGWRMVAAALASLVTGCGSPAPPAASAEQVADGRDIAAAQCATCHAISPGEVSPRTDAPPIDSILARYRPEVLQEELINGIHLGHADMPTFELNPQGVDALLAYLRSIQTTGKNPSAPATPS